MERTERFRLDWGRCGGAGARAQQDLRILFRPGRVQRRHVVDAGGVVVIARKRGVVATDAGKLIFV